MFDPRILVELDPKHRKPVTEEIARLCKEVDDLRLANEEIEKETIRQMLGMSEDVYEYYGRFNFGPFYFTYALNELAFGPWATISDGYLTAQFHFLFYTVGIEIPIGKQNEDENN